MKDLWVEKYRPSSIDTYVFRDDNQRKQVTGWKVDGALPVSYTHLTLPTILLV